MNKATLTERRGLHVNLPAGVHRKLRIRAAIADITLQELIVPVIIALVKDDGEVGGDE